LIKLTSIKLFSIGIGAATGFIQIYLFSRFLGEDNFSFIILLFGLSSFGALFDIVSRPAYGLLREAFSRDEPWQKNMVLMTRFCMLQSLAFGITLGLILIFYSIHIASHTLSINTLLVLIGSLLVTVFLSGLRIIASALGHYLTTEYIELFRRTMWLIAITTVMIDTSLSLAAWIMFITALMAAGALMRLLSDISGQSTSSFFHWNYNDFRTTFSLVGRPGTNSAILLFCETLTYNLGFLVSQKFGGSEALIQFGIWQKIFMLGVMLSQIYPDIAVHRISKNYFISNLRDARYGLGKSTFVGFCILGLFLILVFVFHGFIFDIWLNGQYQLDNLQLIALAIWFGASGIQHSSGLILSYTGGSFKEIRNMSASVTVGILLIAIPTFLVSGSLGAFLVTGGIVYLIGACFYLIRCYRFLSPKRVS
jgi:O-antigen/teichoic acid export membrane protein